MPSALDTNFLLIAATSVVCGCAPPGDRGPHSSARNDAHREADLVGDVALAPERLGSGSDCRLVEQGRGHLRLADGSWAYVEPQVALPTRTGLLLAGQPSYTAIVDELGRGSQAEELPFFGVFVEGDSIRPIPYPPGAEDIGWVRGVALGPDRWAFLFDEVAPGESVLGAPRRTWFGVMGTDGWSALEPIPVPDGGRLEGVSTASLSHGPAFSIAFAPDTGGREALLYERGPGGWEVRTVVERWLDEVTLSTVSGTTLAVTGLDPAYDARIASVRTLDLEGREPGPIHHQVEIPGARARRPVLVGDRPLELGWLRQGPGGETSAWVKRDIRATEGGPGPMRLATGVAGIAAVSVDDSTTLWLTHEVDALTFTSDQYLGFTLSTSGGLRRVGRIAYPFMGPFVAHFARTATLMIVGPDAVLGPTSSYVRSLLIRLELECT